MKLIAARGCGSDWPRQVPGGEVSVLLPSPSISKRAAQSRGAWHEVGRNVSGLAVS